MNSTVVKLLPAAAELAAELAGGEKELAVRPGIAKVVAGLRYPRELKSTHRAFGCSL